MNDGKGGKAVLAALLCAGLLVSGCKDLFHPEGPSESPESRGQYTVTFDADGGRPATQTRTVNRGDSLRSGITNITYSSISGGTWVLLDGVYMSPATGHGGITKARISFTSTGINTYLSIQLMVSSEQEYDWAFISTLDNASATYESGYYEGGRISGSESVTVTIPVPNPGSHFIDIGYQKDGSDTGGYDAAAFMIADSGGSDNMPEEPVKSGYTFGGWYTQRNGGGSQFTSDATVSGNITVYAWWTSTLPDQYTVTFNADGGTPETQTRTVNSGGSLGSANMPGEPAKSGYVFAGWYTQRNGGGSQFTSGTLVSGNIIVYAWWTSSPSVQYTVTFYAEDGNPETQTRTVNSGASLGAANMPGEPAKSGYVFAGWYTQRNGGGSQFTSGTLVSGNITVYAWWTSSPSVQYTVTFYAEDGNPETQTRTVNSGASLGADMPGEPARDGYTFGGWFTQEDGGGAQFTADTTVSGNMTVYARWTRVQYTVTFDADGGTPTPQPQLVDSGDSLDSMPEEPAKSGYTFGGWYTQRNGGGSRFTDDTDVTENMTVYARWTPSVSVQIDLGVQGDPLLEAVSLFANEEAAFSTGSGYASYTWYWDGGIISGEGSSSYTLAANSRAPGIYELSVFVTAAGGEILSARCQVTIKAHGGGTE